MTDLTGISGERRPETRMGARSGYPGKVQGNQRDPLEEVSMRGTGGHACLQFLWILLGPGASGRSNELTTILDKLIAIAPHLEVDRRLQWLEQNRAMRFE